MSNQRFTKYELFQSNEGWYAQTHCDCGTTRSSGEHFHEVGDAVTACSDNMTEHLADHGPKCGIEKQQPQNQVASLLAEASANTVVRS